MISGTGRGHRDFRSEIFVNESLIACESILADTVREVAAHQDDVGFFRGGQLECRFGIMHAPAIFARCKKNPLQ